tara:strand:- start:957 stop:1274 length:318 start_codon:yes stop_codon:yes gene_type:complete
VQFEWRSAGVGVFILRKFSVLSVFRLGFYMRASMVERAFADAHPQDLPLRQVKAKASNFCIAIFGRISGMLMVELTILLQMQSLFLISHVFLRKYATYKDCINAE